MTNLIYIIILLSAVIIFYNILIIIIRHSRNNSPWRHLGESLFASMSRFYERVSSGTQRIYNSLANKSLNNILGLFGTIICTVAMYFLMSIDISFISLMGAQFWGSKPELLAREISEATKTVISIEGLTDYFDAFLNWAVSHVSTNPNGHFLAANALITIVCLLVAGLFLKECARPAGWLPLNLQKAGRWVVGTLSSLLLLCLMFYYGFLIFYGVSSQSAVVTSNTKQTDFFSSEQIDNFNNLEENTDESRNNPLDSLNGTKLAASVCYAVAVLGVNFLAFWGSLLFYGIVITLLLILFRWLLEGGYDYFILPLGIALGYVQLQAHTPNIALNQNQRSQINEQTIDEQDHSLSNAEQTETDQAGELNIEENNVDEIQSLRDEVEERRIAEEERQRNIHNDPLNLN